MANTISSTHSDFYVYVLFRENGVPFYIGKGRGNQWAHHERAALRGAKGHKCAIIRAIQARGIEVIKAKIHDGLTEGVAHEYEVALIAAVGRGRIGPLVNLTNGGDGVAGFKHLPGVKRSPEHVANLAAALRGKKRSPEHIAKRSAARAGKPQSAEARRRISIGMTGKERSAEHCARLSAAKTGTKHSAETLSKMSASKVGVPWSAARRAAQDARVCRMKACSPPI